MNTDEHWEHPPTADAYRKQWTSVRARIIMGIVVVLLIGGVAAYVIIANVHGVGHTPESGF